MLVLAQEKRRRNRPIPIPVYVLPIVLSFLPTYHTSLQVNLVELAQSQWISEQKWNKRGT